MPSRKRARVNGTGNDIGFKETSRTSSDSEQEEVAQSRVNASPLEPPSVELEDCHVIPASSTPEPYIFNLPLEVLGEILILTESPRHVLAFARTCKRFCYALISQGAGYIWRRARRGSQCTFPSHGLNIISLPDPPKQFFSEAAYAAFVFDPGACDVS